MSHGQDAKDALGKTVIHRKKGKRYYVQSANKDGVYLKALDPGARSTSKWIEKLWLDYEEWPKRSDAASKRESAE